MLDYSSVGPEAMDSDEEGMHDYAYIGPGFTSGFVMKRSVRLLPHDYTGSGNRSRPAAP